MTSSAKKRPTVSSRLAAAVMRRSLDIFAQSVDARAFHDGWRASKPDERGELFADIMRRNREATAKHRLLLAIYRYARARAK